MYKIQRMQALTWAANQTLTANLETLIDQLGGNPLHVAEVILLFKGSIDGGTQGFTGLDLGRIVDGWEIIPNEVCESSRVDGRSAWTLDKLLTGREVANNVQGGGPGAGQTVDLIFRLPYHGCLNGAKSGRYGDLVSPVRRFWRGNVNVRTGPAVFSPDTDASIESGTFHVLFVTEPLPDAYHIGPMPVYDLYRRPAGDSFTWVSKGRLMLLALDGASSAYPTVDIRDACWVSGLDNQDLIAAWQSTQALGAGNEVFGGTSGQMEQLPLLWTRPCDAKLWTSPRFTRGNRNVDVPNNTADDGHRVVTAQLLTSRQSIRQLEVDVGRKAVGPRITPKNAGDLIKAGMVQDYLPRRIPVWARDRLGRLVRSSR